MSFNPRDHDVRRHRCVVCGLQDRKLKLLSYCPGVKLTEEAREDIANGRVVDVFRWIVDHPEVWQKNYSLKGK